MSFIIFTNKDSSEEDIEEVVTNGEGCSTLLPFAVYEPVSDKYHSHYGKVLSNKK